MESTGPPFTASSIFEASEPQGGPGGVPVKQTAFPGTIPFPGVALTNAAMPGEEKSKNRPADVASKAVPLANVPMGVKVISSVCEPSNNVKSQLTMSSLDNGVFNNPLVVMLPLTPPVPSARFN